MSLPISSNLKLTKLTDALYGFTIALGTAKNIFHTVELSKTGRMLRRKKLKRRMILQYFANIPCTTIVMESCGGSHYWAGELKARRGNNKACLAVANKLARIAWVILRREQITIRARAKGAHLKAEYMDAMIKLHT